MKKKYHLLVYTTAILLFYSQLFAEETTKELPKSLKLGVMIDSYYSYNTYKPITRERQYTTQAVRNDEMNINLAFVEVGIEEEKYRGKLAIQYGTSVNTNYSGELSRDVSSNQNSVKHIQEAYVGFKIGKKTWVDAGIYLGHIGFESWISSDNWNYTRSLSSDYVPYYASGVRVSHEFSDTLTGQIHVMNGWQNITETNKDKSFGGQLKYKPMEHFSITYNNFIGNEGLDTERKQTRHYHDLVMEWRIADWISVATLSDVGFQRNKQAFLYEPYWNIVDPTLSAYRETNSKSYQHWYQGGLWLKLQWDPLYRISFRGDRMYDPEQVLAQTGTKDGFMTNSYTATFDYLDFSPGLLRFEYIQRDSYNKIFVRFANSLSRKEELVAVSFSIRY
ncbi:porin [Leptospira sp. 96542]|nr:porin [Leptospira sp. 96542]